MNYDYTILRDADAHMQALEDADSLRERIIGRITDHDFSAIISYDDYKKGVANMIETMLGETPDTALVQRFIDRLEDSRNQRIDYAERIADAILEDL